MPIPCSEALPFHVVPQSFEETGNGHVAHFIKSHFLMWFGHVCSYIYISICSSNRSNPWFSPSLPACRLYTCNPSLVASHEVARQQTYAEVSFDYPSTPSPALYSVRSNLGKTRTIKLLCAQQRTIMLLRGFPTRNLYLCPCNWKCDNVVWKLLIQKCQDYRGPPSWKTMSISWTSEMSTCGHRQKLTFVKQISIDLADVHAWTFYRCPFTNKQKIKPKPLFEKIAVTLGGGFELQSTVWKSSA